MKQKRIMGGLLETIEKTVPRPPPLPMKKTKTKTNLMMMTSKMKSTMMMQRRMNVRRNRFAKDPFFLLVVRLVTASL
jgi:hypothetical protein